MKKLFLLAALLGASLSWAKSSDVSPHAVPPVPKPAACFIKVESRYINVAFIQQFYVTEDRKSVILMLQNTFYQQDISHRVIRVAAANPEGYAAQLASTIAECGR